MRLWLVNGSLARSSTRRHPPTWCAWGGEQNINRVYRAAPQGACEHGDAYNIINVGVWVPQTRFEGASPGAVTCVCGVWRAGVWIVSRIFAGTTIQKITSRSETHTETQTRLFARLRTHVCTTTTLRWTLHTQWGDSVSDKQRPCETVGVRTSGMQLHAVLG